ncbi:MAG: hypothetical protein AAFN41_10935 [Planctomycetota bacterium]
MKRLASAALLLFASAALVGCACSTCSGGKACCGDGTGACCTEGAHDHDHGDDAALRQDLLHDGDHAAS